MEVSDPSPAWLVHEIVKRAATAPVLVVGGGITGVAVAKLFVAGGVEVVVLDEKEVSAKSKDSIGSVRYIERLKLEDQDGRNQLRQQLYDTDFAFAIVSPGVNPRGNLVKTIQESGITILSELDFAFSFLGYPEVCVTGTNGKSTVVKLITEMLNCSGLEAEAVGNIGLPLSARVSAAQLNAVLSATELESEPRALFVAELSSYQIEWLQFHWRRALGGQVSVYLNLSDDHLERHATIDGYVLAKAKLFAIQGEQDWAVVNKDDPFSKQIIQVVQGKYLPFGTAKFAPKLNSYCYIEQESSLIRLAVEGQEVEFSTTSWNPPGYHNRENLAASISAAILAGATIEGVREAYSKFTSLPHRVEKVGEVAGVSYINDSKGTNVSAVVVALDTVRSDLRDQQGIVLLLGGALKEGSWEGVKQNLLNVRGVVYFGRDGEKIKQQLVLEDGVIERVAGDLKSAVPLARDLAKEGDVVLLSPGCASFDAYNNYEERGEDFRRIVLEMKR